MCMIHCPHGVITLSRLVNPAEDDNARFKYFHQFKHDAKDITNGDEEADECVIKT